MTQSEEEIHLREALDEAGEAVNSIFRLEQIEVEEQARRKKKLGSIYMDARLDIMRETSSRIEDPIRFLALPTVVVSPSLEPSAEPSPWTEAFSITWSTSFFFFIPLLLYVYIVDRLACYSSNN